MIPADTDVGTTNASVLLIEDDPAVLHMLQATVQYGGFTSEQASSASEALERLASQSFDSVLLDLGLPDVEGRHLIAEIRRRSDIPILVVSGRDDERTRIEALDAGADDFVAKPFLPGELLARIRAAIRRHDPTAAETTRSEEPEPASNSFSTYRTIRPGSMEEKLLTFLRIHEGELVTSDDIINGVWGRSKSRTERNVRVLVAMVRRKLNAQMLPFEIINEHGRGYRLRRIDRDRT
jgi:two-component system KDP operon response regulator KdpE